MTWMERAYGRAEGRLSMEEVDADVAGGNARAKCWFWGVSDGTGLQTTGDRHCLGLIQCSPYR